MQPTSFDQDNAAAWSQWVLANGLPQLPGPNLEIGESVPVAYWVGPTTAAVLHIRRIYYNDEDEVTETDIDLFCLVDGQWQGSGSGGAGGWEAGVPPLVPPPLAADWVALDGIQSGGSLQRGCKALWGEVGVDVAAVEVDQDGRATRRPVEAPAGMIVVSGEVTTPFTVSLFTTAGALLKEIKEPAGM
jgi:hypothetical protein